MPNDALSYFFLPWPIQGIVKRKEWSNSRWSNPSLSSSSSNSWQRCTLTKYVTWDGSHPCGWPSSSIYCFIGEKNSQTLIGKILHTSVTDLCTPIKMNKPLCSIIKEKMSNKKGPYISIGQWKLGKQYAYLSYLSQVLYPPWLIWTCSF